MPTQITGEFIKNAVAKKITDAFGETAVIAKEKITKFTDDFKPPCFIIFENSISQSKKLKDKRERTYSIIVHWLPDDNSQRKYEDCARAGNTLLEALDSLDTNEGITHGKDVNYEIVDDVLHCYANYSVKMIKEKESAPLMQDADINENYIQ